MSNPTFVPEKWVAITPSDTADQPYVVSALLADTSGSVKVGFKDGTSATLPIVAGVPLPGRVVKVFATPAPPALHGALY